MAKVQFTAVLKKFDEQGEKTGWTYFEISQAIASKIKKGQRTSFRVKGKIDAHPISQVATLPMGDGSFIIPVNSTMRKAIGKRQGATVTLQLEADESEFKMNSDFMDCLADEPKAQQHFKTLAPGHQRYFSKWIDSAKTEDTRAKRITMAIRALAMIWGYPEMIRAAKRDKET